MENNFVNKTRTNCPSGIEFCTNALSNVTADIGSGFCNTNNRGSSDLIINDTFYWIISLIRLNKFCFSSQDFVNYETNFFRQSSTGVNDCIFNDDRIIRRKLINSTSQVRLS